MLKYRSTEGIKGNKKTKIINKKVGYGQMYKQTEIYRH